MTYEEASTLDKSDLCKYIGTEGVGYNNMFGCFQRRVFPLQERPKLTSKKILSIKYYGSVIICRIEDLALCERGDPIGIAMRHAQRLVPINLKGFKKNISDMVRKAQENVDGYINGLPLHKKMELFKSLTPEEKVIYECLYKDIEVLIGLKEEPDAT